MVRGLLLIAASVTSLVSIVVPANAVDAPQPGLWEVSSKSERAGVVKPLRTRTRCITPEQARDFANKWSREFTTAYGTCKSIDPRKTENGMSWQIRCSTGMPIEATASYEFDTPQHYVATLRSRLTRADKTVTSTLTIEGKRIGECPQ